MVLGTSWGTHWGVKKTKNCSPPPLETRLLCLPGKDIGFCQHGYFTTNCQNLERFAFQVLMDIIEKNMGGMERVICCHPHPRKNLTWKV